MHPFVVCSVVDPVEVDGVGRGEGMRRSTIWRVGGGAAAGRDSGTVMSALVVVVAEDVDEWP